MTTTTTPRRTMCTLAAVLAAAACTPTVGAAPPSPPPTSATASETTTAPSLTPSPTTTTTTQTTTATPTPNNGVRTRAPAEVTGALLDTRSFVAGIHEVNGAVAVTVTSSNPKCAAFVNGAGGRNSAPGVTAYATVAFQDDVDPFPFVIEEITTVGTLAHAGDVLAALDGSTPGCPKLTMKVPGVGSSTMTVSRVTAPAHGDHPTAARVTGTSGAARGLYLTLVATGVDDAVVQLTFIQATESDIEGVTADAVDRVRKAFTYTKPS